MKNENSELENLMLILNRRICKVEESIEKYTKYLAPKSPVVFKPFTTGYVNAKREELYFLHSAKQELAEPPALHPQRSTKLLLENFVGATKVRAICYVMANAYRTELNWTAACKKVLQKYPGTSYVYMFGLWEAIDAYNNL